MSDFVVFVVLFVCERVLCFVNVCECVSICVRECM